MNKWNPGVMLAVMVSCMVLTACVTITFITVLPVAGMVHAMTMMLFGAASVATLVTVIVVLANK